jgi:type VI secretion system protein ImpC
MLWGHPALLALTVLGRQGAPLVVEDLPFHHYVDEDGDSVALPCTDRLISTAVASLLREAGINAVMAHKGEALVRFNGLEAVNGDGLAVSGAAPRPAPSNARFVMQSKIDAKRARVSEDFAPAVRKRSMAPAADEPVVGSAEEPSEMAPAADEPVVESAEERSEQAADEATDSGAESDSATAGKASAPDHELAALLAGSGEPAPAEDDPSAEAAIDPDLAALLKSLG